MSIKRAALMIRQAQRPKRITLTKLMDIWVVRNDWACRTTYCGTFDDARESVEVEMLERLWQISMREELT